MKTIVKGLIGREDFSLGSGTFLRTTSNGGSQTMHQVSLPPASYISASQFTGVDNTDRINQAIAALPKNASGGPTGVVDATGLPNETSGGSQNIDPGISSAVRILLGPVDYYIKQITLQSNLQIIGAGSNTAGNSLPTRLISVDATVSPIIVSQTQAAQGVILKGFALFGKNSGTQNGIDIQAPAISSTGLWYSEFDDLLIQNFTGTPLNIVASAASNPGINQFLNFNRVRAFRSQNSTHFALQIKGWNNSLLFLNCQFDSTLNTVDAQTNINITQGVSGTTFCPYDIVFIGVTCQWSGVGVSITGADCVSFIHPHFEEIQQGINIGSGAQFGTSNVSIIGGGGFTSNPFVGTVGGMGSGNGWVLKNFASANTGSISITDFHVNGTPDNFALGNNVAINGNCVTGVNGALTPVTTKDSGTPTVTLRIGSTSGTYSTVGTSFSAVDGSNLAYTVTIPTGWKLLINATGIAGNTTAAPNNGAVVAIADGATILQQTGVTSPSAGIGTQFALCYVITGDNNSHVIQLQFKTTNASDSCIIQNTTGGQLPVMTFLLTPSN